MPNDLLSQQSELRAHMFEFYLWKRMWEEHTDPFPFQWEIRPLQGAERNNIPNVAGIYSLLVQPGIASHPGCSYLMYVGRTNSLHRRFGEYLNEAKREMGRPKIYRLLNMYPEHVFFCFARVPDEDLSASEEALLVAYMPPANDQLPARVGRLRSAFT